MTKRCMIPALVLVCGLAVLSPVAGQEPATGEGSLYHMAALSLGYVAPTLGVQDAC